MALRKGLPAKKAATDASDSRFDFRNLVVCNNDGTPRGGVTSPVGVDLVSATASMNVAVAPFNADGVRDRGVVLLSNDDVSNVLLNAAPDAGSRIDVIAARQDDSSSTVSVPDGDDLPRLTFILGQAGTSPLKPAVPDGWVELATVLIPFGAAATNSTGVVITQTAQFTAAPGAAVPFRSFDKLSSWTTATVGQLAVVFADAVPANNGMRRWDGAAWSVALSTFIRDTIAFINTGGNIPGGVNVQSVGFGAQPFERRILIDAQGFVSPSSAGDVGVNLSAAGGTLTKNPGGQERVYHQIGAQWYAYYQSAYLTLPANTSSTLTLLSVCSVASNYQLALKTRTLVAGEY